MKRATLVLAGLMCLPMAGSSSAERAGDSNVTQRGTGLAIDWHSIDGGGTMFSLNPLEGQNLEIGSGAHPAQNPGSSVL